MIVTTRTLIILSVSAMFIRLIIERVIYATAQHFHNLHNITCGQHIVHSRVLGTVLYYQIGKSLALNLALGTKSLALALSGRGRAAAESASGHLNSRLLQAVLI